MTPRILCPRCLTFLPESASGLLLLPPAPQPLRPLFVPGSSTLLVLARDGWHPTLHGVPVPTEGTATLGSTLFYDSGPVPVPRWLGVPALSVRSA